MKEYLKSISGFEFPDDFVELAKQFKLRFGSNEKALETIGEYIGYDYIVNYHEVRGYEAVPFEAQLPFATGSNGEHMGWLNLSPEIKEFQKPIITWAPMGCLVIYHGLEFKNVFEGKVKYLHEENKYENVDLEFLNSLGINPIKGISVEQFVNYEQNNLTPIPISEETNWRYEETFDGVGVYAKSEYFSPSHELISPNLNTKGAIDKIKKLNIEEKYATSIWLIKNSISNSYFSDEPFEFILKLYDLAIVAYNALGRETISEIIKDKYIPSR